MWSYGRKGRGMHVQKWDYIVFQINARKVEDASETISKSLSTLGEDGWELVSTVLQDRTILFILKRPL
jgi:hypothetical protein